MSKKWKSRANWKDPNWKYVNSASTDVSKTIERVRKEMAALNVEAKDNDDKKVTQLRDRKVK